MGALTIEQARTDEEIKALRLHLKAHTWAHGTQRMDELLKEAFVMCADFDLAAAARDARTSGAGEGVRGQERGKP